MTPELVGNALARREKLLERLRAEDTDCYRLFHGIAEGRPGVAIDRYGPLLLFQSWREPPSSEEIDAAREAIEGFLGEKLLVVWSDRSGARRDALRPSELPENVVGRELGLRFDVTPRIGADPLLFLDFRRGRRRIREMASGKSVLNLFAYTCGVGVAAAAAGAREVWNVDFSRTALETGARNLALNDLPAEGTRFVVEDVFPVVRQLAGLPVATHRGARGRRRERRFTRFEPRSFDLVVLDPPRWSTGPFGAVDVVRDYPALFKPALLATAEGGALLAMNNAAEVERDGWLRILERTAEKCGRRLRSLELLEPEEDFPSFDASPPLKIAWIEV